MSRWNCLRRRSAPRLLNALSARCPSLLRRGPGRGEQGFTLVEIMIAIVLLSIISLSIAQSTRQTFRLRAVIQIEGDFYNSIRLAMGILERDVSMLFSPLPLSPYWKPANAASAVPAEESGNFVQDGAPGGFNPGAAVDAELQQLQASELGQTTDFWLGAKDKTGIRGSRFNGTDSKLSFISASHLRLYKNAPESDFAKIRYELREDKEEDAQKDTRVLVKIEDANVFDDVEKKVKMTKVYPLLRGVKTFALRYYRADKKSWDKSWDNSKDDLVGKYPDLVEVTLEVTGPRLQFKGVYTFKPDMPFEGLDASF